MRRFAFLLTAASLALVTASALSQNRAPTPARYEMDAGTATGTGFGAMGGGNFNPLDMLRGRSGEPRKELYLRLGTAQAPTGGAAQADHFMPEGARLGRSVPLVTPQRAPDTEAEDRVPSQDGERPRGRILIFWGCGARAPAGQPVIIDFARLAAGQTPPGLFSTTVPRDRSVTFANSRTYGDWPNGRSRVATSPQTSLLGAHRVAGNYSPEIAFSLSQDFMPALNATGTAQPDNSTELSWNAVSGATGYYAWTMGFRSDQRGNGGDMVWWSSSTSQQFGGALWDWISPSAVATLIRQQVVLPPTQTRCLVPAEVKAAAPDIMFGNLYAYGPEENFAFPPRPANARTPWNPIWTARVRHRASTSWMIGGPDMGSRTAENGSQPADPNRRCRRRGGIGGAISGALGLPNC